MMSPLISTIVGSSPSHSPETISGIKESDDGKILSSKSNVHAKMYPLSAPILSVIHMVQLPFKDEPTRPSNESTDE